MFCVKLLPKVIGLKKYSNNRRLQEYKETNDWRYCLICKQEYSYDQFKCRFSCATCCIVVQVKENETVVSLTSSSLSASQDAVNKKKQNDTDKKNNNAKQMMSTSTTTSMAVTTKDSITNDDTTRTMILTDEFIKNAQIQRRFYRFRDTIEYAQGLIPIIINKTDEIDNRQKVTELCNNVMATIVKEYKKKDVASVTPALVLKALKKLKDCRSLYKWTNRIWREITVTNEKQFKQNYELTAAMTKRVQHMFLEILQMMSTNSTSEKQTIPYGPWLYWILQILEQNNLAKISMPYISNSKKEKDKIAKTFNEFKTFCLKKNWPTTALTQITVS